MPKKIILAAATLALWATVGAQGATKQVDIGDNFFKPASVKGAVGTAVNWTSPGSRRGHNVREDHYLFNSGPRTADPIDFTVTFSAGTFHYFCDTHGGPNGGMDGTVKISPAIGAKPSGARFTVTWATDDTDSRWRFDIQFKAGSGPWKDWKKDAAAIDSVFGDGGKPTAPEKGTKYSFRVRTQRGKATSQWSPVATFTP